MGPEASEFDHSISSSASGGFRTLQQKFRELGSSGLESEVWPLVFQLVKEGDFRSALDLLDQLAVLNGERLNIVKWMAFCSQQLGDALSSIEKFSRCVTEYADHESLFYLAVSYEMAESFEEAIESYRTFIFGVADESPLLFDALKNLGNCFVKIGDLDSAEEAYHKAFHLNSESDVILVNYGTLEIQRDRYNQAQSRFKQALEVNIDNDKAWVGLALVHRQMADAELAWGNLCRALDLNPTNKTSITLLIQWAVDDCKTDRLFYFLERYLAERNDDDEIRCVAAQFYIDQVLLEEAYCHIQYLLEHDPLSQIACQLLKQVQKVEKDRSAHG